MIRLLKINLKLEVPYDTPFRYCQHDEVFREQDIVTSVTEQFSCRELYINVIG